MWLATSVKEMNDEFVAIKNLLWMMNLAEWWKSKICTNAICNYIGNLIHIPCPWHAHDYDHQWRWKIFLHYLIPIFEILHREWVLCCTIHRINSNFLLDFVTKHNEWILCQYLCQYLIVLLFRETWGNPSMDGIVTRLVFLLG